MSSKAKEVLAYDLLKVKNFLSLEAYLQIHELKEDKNENLHQRALEIYKAKVDSFIQNKRVEEGYLNGMNAELLMQSKKNTMLTGKAIWNKAVAVKAKIINNFTPAWIRQFNSDGSIPSGKSVDDMLSQALKTMHDDAKVESTRENTGTEEGKDDSRDDEEEEEDAKAGKIPNEWLTFKLRGLPAKYFLQHGLSDEIYICHHFFDIKKGNGPRVSSVYHKQMNHSVQLFYHYKSHKNLSLLP